MARHIRDTHRSQLRSVRPSFSCSHSSFDSLDDDQALLSAIEDCLSVLAVEDSAPAFEGGGGSFDGGGASDSWGSSSSGDNDED